MNREIKFKAINFDNKWSNGYYLQVGYQHYISEKQYNKVINKNTLCQLITKIGDVEVYEYDCFLWFGEIHYFFYNEIGFLELKCFNTDLLLIVEEFNENLWQVFTQSNDAKFIGNWHDGEEYLLTKIKELV